MGEGTGVSGTSNGQRDHHRGNLTSIAITIIIAIMMMIRQEARASGASTTISCRAGRGAEKHTLLIQARLGQCAGFFDMKVPSRPQSTSNQ